MTEEEAARKRREAEEAEEETARKRRKTEEAERKRREAEQTTSGTGRTSHADTVAFYDYLARAHTSLPPRRCEGLKFLSVAITRSPWRKPHSGASAPHIASDEGYNI